MTQKKNAIKAARTRQQARDWLRRQGKSVPQFCRETGLDTQAVYDLLSGRAAGTFGKSHRAAVALGLKLPPPPDVQDPA
ncbi:phage-associated protein, BcepMu gp16 family [Methylomagnum ishizawai]|uniref:Phage-associated protein, BcepMu gp16 family n=1 Tax=Methylomagnum ishizawai TaxID=1760988 RepID=A0A1Y6CVU4_9GAMM|nr:DNA-binding protein [Methylomagnum ishizawai]SMF94406.1 phage-associated protein, BcepMu gp16 family [Methylomagnum ishizawai]